jgi:spermidine/putrescine transport system permease protein
MLAFSLSIDDFVTSNFVAGQTVTFPLWVYGAVKVGIPPQVFVLGTAIFMAGITLAILALVFQGRSKKKQHIQVAPSRAGGAV